MKLIFSSLLLVISACATAPKQPMASASKVAVASVNIESAKSVEVSKPQIEEPTKIGFKEIKSQQYNHPNEFFALSKLKSEFYGNRFSFLVSGIEKNEDKLAQGDQFQKILKETTEDWITVSVETLAPLGLKEGDIIQYYNFEEDTVKSYVLKNKVHLLIISSNTYDSSEESYLNRTFYILLNDDEVQSSYTMTPVLEDNVVGIAYRGNKYKLRPSNIQIPRFNPIEKVDEVTEKIHENIAKSWNKDKSQIVLSYFRKRSVGNITNYQVIATNLTIDKKTQPYLSPTSSFSILKLEDDSLFSIYSSFHEKRDKEVYRNQPFYNFFESNELVMIEPDNGCYSLYVVTGSEVEHHPIKCSLFLYDEN